MLMKKFLILSVCLLLSAISYAQTLPGGFSHIIDVGQYSDWGKGYLTITDTHFMSISNANNKFWSYFTYYPENGSNLYCGNIILAVDGTSAAGWTKEDFYKKVDNRKDIITLKIRAQEKGKFVDKEVKIHPLYSLPDELKQFGNVFASINGETIVQERKRKLLKETIYEERKDDNFDFFSCFYYDFLLKSNDPLLDMEILKKVDIGDGRRERNEKKPDVIFTIARDANENINSVYIPPSSRTVNVGSTTRARYNYFTKQNDYVTTQRNQTIHEGGYTQETKTADLFLEIAALDTKKLNDKSISYPPIVWKATVKRHVLNPNFNLNEELNVYAGWMTFPPFDRKAYCDEKRIYAPIGVNFSTLEPKEIKRVIEGSPAEVAGLLPGDVIVKADIPNGNKYQRKFCKQNVKQNGWSGLGAYTQYECLVTILRNGKKMEFRLMPKFITLYRYPYWVGAK